MFPPQALLLEAERRGGGTRRNKQNKIDKVFGWLEGGPMDKEAAEAVGYPDGFALSNFQVLSTTSWY